MKRLGHMRGREWIVFALLSVLVAFFYAPILAGIRTFPDGDFVHHFFPFSLFQHQAIADGRLALWNPYTYGGHPFLADVQAGVFYPLSNLIYVLTLPVTDAAARLYWLQVEAVLHTLLAGYFAYLWTRDLCGNRWGGLVAGISFALSGYITGYAPLQLAVLRTAIWLPLLLWTLGRGWQQPRQWRWWLGSIVVLSVAFLGGHSQTFLLVGYAAGLWVLWLALTIRPWRMASVIGALAVLWGCVLLTSAQWMPSVEFFGYSVRANVDYAFVSGGLAWTDFWQLLLPRVLTQFSPLYIGVVGLILTVIALMGMMSPRAKPTNEMVLLLPARAGTLFCLTLLVLALLASLGGNGPLYPLLYRIAPGWSWFRGQERAAFLVVLALSGLAAYGMAAIFTLSPKARRRAALLAGAVVVGGVYAFGLLWQLQGRTAIDHAGYLLVAGMTLIVGLAVASMVATPGWSMRRSAWIVTLVVVNLVWANAGTNQAAGTPQERILVAPEVEAVIQAVNARAEVASGLSGRVYNEYRAYDDYGMRAQVEDVWGSSPLRVARYAALFDEFPLDRMWRLLGVEHVLTWRRELFGPSELLGEFPQATDTTYLHRLPEGNPRAWVVPQAVMLDDDAALALLADHEFDLNVRGLLGMEYEGFAEVEEAQPVVASVTLDRLTPEALNVRVQSDADALLIVGETWLPGWTVVDAMCGGAMCPTVDTQGRNYFAVMRADVTLLGLWIPAGESTFTLRYDPISVRLGLWVSGVTLLVLLLVGLWRVLMARRIEAKIP